MENIVAKLEFLATIKPGYRVDVESMTQTAISVTNLVWTSPVRWLTGKSRYTDLEQIEKLISYIETELDDRVDSDEYIQIIGLLSKTTGGLANLELTYKDDIDYFKELSELRYRITTLVNRTFIP